jgi:cAMP-specific phosphodiesterase 4
MDLAIQTIEELDWCLVQLEKMQSYKKISDSASNKVNKNKNKKMKKYYLLKIYVFLSLKKCLIKN